MPKYQEIINKIQTGKNFTQSELELIKEALETIQFLEIFFKERRIKENESLK
jgi:hypothetical protein